MSGRFNDEAASVVAVAGADVKVVQRMLVDANAEHLRRPVAGSARRSVRRDDLQRLLAPGRSEHQDGPSMTTGPAPVMAESRIGPAELDHDLNWRRRDIRPTSQA